MYLNSGTNEAQFSRIARWTLAGLILFGMISWWHPSFVTWGAMSAGLMMVMALWLISQLLAGKRVVPGNPLQLAIIGPAAVMAWHTCMAIINDPAGRAGMSGAMNASLLFHMGLLSLSVMLVQSLLHRTADHNVVVSVAGLAMSLGAMLAVLLTDKTFAIQALVLTSYAGLAIWLTPMWRQPQERRQEEHWLPGAKPLAVAGRIVFALAVAAVVGFNRPAESIAAIVIIAACLIFCLLVFLFSRWIMATFVALIIGAAATLAIFNSDFVLDAIGDPASATGAGESVFGYLVAKSSGLAILGASTGFIGLTCAIAAFLAAMLLMLRKAKRLNWSGRAAAISWTCATALIGAAILGPTGMFMPSVNLALGLVWGLAPSFTGCPQKDRTGFWLTAAMIGLLLLLGMAANEGLIGWGINALGGSDKILHTTVGLLAGLTFTWFAGAKNTWLGIIAVVLIIAAGAAGEVLQGQFTIRGMEMEDWIADLAGATAALVIYLLCRGARLCEMPGAAPTSD